VTINQCPVKNTDVLMSWQTGGYLEMVLSVSKIAKQVEVMQPNSQAKSLSTDRIQVRKRNQCIVEDIFTAIFFPGLSDFMPQFSLNVLMLSEDVEYPR